MDEIDFVLVVLLLSDLNVLDLVGVIFRVRLAELDDFSDLLDLGSRQLILLPQQLLQMREPNAELLRLL